jgi:hypothetical protein
MKLAVCNTALYILRHDGVEIQLPAFSAYALHGQLHALATLLKGSRP